MKKAAAILFFLSMAIPYPAMAWPGWLNVETGVKGAVGADLWLASSPTVGFAENTAGFAGGVGPFAELRFIKYLGLDFEFLFGWDKIVEKDTVGATEVVFTAKAFNFKMPILLKAVLPLPGVKLSLGTGPILEIPISGKGEVNNSAFSLDVKTKFSLLWAANLGIDIKLPKGFRLPIDFRAAYNLSQPSSYSDRVKGPLNRLQITYQNTWEFRLLFGVAYELP